MVINANGPVIHTLVRADPLDKQLVIARRLRGKLESGPEVEAEPRPRLTLSGTAGVGKQDQGQVKSPREPLLSFPTTSASTSDKMSPPIPAPVETDKISPPIFAPNIPAEYSAPTKPEQVDESLEILTEKEPEEPTPDPDEIALFPE